ncbi:unnamed protein product [Pylaiella littoralis]
MGAAPHTRGSFDDNTTICTSSTAARYRSPHVKNDCDNVVYLSIRQLAVRLRSGRHRLYGWIGPRSARGSLLKYTACYLPLQRAKKILL